MASIMRPQFVRSAIASASTKRFVQPSTPVLCMGRSLLQQRSMPITSKIAAFHVSRKNQLLPPLPQSVPGTVNDPVPVPPSAPMHGNYHWDFERLVATALIPLSIAPFVSGAAFPLVDGLLGSLVIVHSHIGFQSVIVDYFPKRRVPGVQKALLWLLNGATALVLYGFYEFETNDVGVTEAVKRVWSA